MGGLRVNAPSRAAPLPARITPPTFEQVVSTLSIRVGAAKPDTKAGGNGNARWFGPGRSVQVRGRDLQGMVYVGTAMTPYPALGVDASAGNAACLIDPTFPVPPTDGHGGFPEMGYWPKYGAISTEARQSYLDWLAEGRPAPAGIGYVFLFFYGLERRLLCEDPSPEEAAALLAEIARLREEHPNHSFMNYSLGFVELLQAKILMSSAQGLKRWRPDPAARPRATFLLKVAVACRVVCGEPIPYELAMACLMARPENQGALRIAALRAPQELVALVRPRFLQTFPSGFRLADRETSRLFADYRSPSLLPVELSVAAPIGRLPDPMTLSWTRLEQLAGMAGEELGHYARKIGGKRQKACSLESLSLLPKGVVHADVGGRKVALDAYLAGLAGPFAKLSFDELAGRCLSVHQDLSAKSLTVVAGILDRSGFGVEPDPRSGTRISAKTAGTMRVFRADPAASPAEPSDAYVTARAAVTAAIFAGGAKSVGWGAALEQAFSLNAGEALRLTAHSDWLAERGVTAAVGKRAVAELAAVQRQAAARAVTAAVLAAGDEASSLPFLERLHEVLEVERSHLYGAVHAASGEPGPGRRAPDGRKPAVAADPPAPRGPVTLDPERLSRLQAETAAVSEILAAVFAEEEAPKPAPPVAADLPDSRFKGLDAKHSGLAASLVTRPEWTRAEYEALVRGAGLMPGGALDTINEWAFDAMGEALAEDGDPVTVNAALLPPSQSED
jgi:hypothetical protein